MSNYSPVFIVIPTRIWNLPGITIQLLKFYEKIFQFWHRGNECFVNNETLREYAGMSSPSSVSDAFKFFESCGEIKRIIRNGKRYILPPTPNLLLGGIAEDDQEIDDEGLAPARGGSRPSERGGLATARHNNKTNNIKNNNTKPSSSSDDEGSSFDQFWQVYPKKTDKLDAQRFWKKNRLYEKANHIICDVKERVDKEWRFKEKQFIPSPARYLNKQLWTNEIMDNSHGGRNHGSTKASEPTHQQRGLERAREEYIASLQRKSLAAKSG